MDGVKLSTQKGRTMVEQARPKDKKKDLVTANPPAMPLVVYRQYFVA